MITSSPSDFCLTHLQVCHTFTFVSHFDQSDQRSVNRAGRDCSYFILMDLQSANM
jgi:hypothetical protein